MSNLRLDTSEQAQAAFYSAFESASLEAMMAVWSKDRDIVCVHPHGPRLIGRAQVKEGWRQILRHSPPMRFKISQMNQVAHGDLAIHYVNEHIHVGDEDEPDFVVLATNVYRRSEDGWRMILHHASPTPESLRNMRNRQQKDETDEDEDEVEVTMH